MDGGISGAAALIEIIDFAWKVSKKIKQLQQAPIELQAIQSELEVFYGLVKRLLSLAYNDKTLAKDLAPPLTVVDAYVRKIDAFITKTCRNHTLWRARWVLHQDEASKLQRDLHAALVPVNTVLGAFSVDSHLKIDIRDEQIERRLVQLIAAVSTSHKSIEQMESAIDELQLLALRKPQTTTLDLPPAYTGNGRSNAAIVKSSSQTLARHHVEDEQLVGKFGVQSDQGQIRPDVVTCKRGCRCACHRGSNLRVYRTALFGSAYLSFRGIPLLTQKCTVADCDGPTANFAVSAGIHLPAWLLAKVVRFSVLSNRWHEPCINLTVRSILHDNGDWFWSVRHGHIGRVKELIKEHPTLVSATDNAGLNSLMYLLWPPADYSQPPDRDTQAELASVLVQSGADPHALTWTGNSFYRSQVIDLFLRKERGLITSKRSLLPYSEIWDNMPDGHRFVLGDKHGSLKIYLKENPHAVNEEDECKRTALWWAAAAGNVEAVVLLLRHGADIDKQDEEGRNALHAGILWPHEDLDSQSTIIKAMIARQPRLELTDQYKKTFLHHAPRIFKRETMNLLALQCIHAGVEIDAADWQGRTALMTWVWNRDLTTVEIDLLLDAGGNINALDDLGWNVLMVAIQSARPRTTRNLLERGADYTAVDAARRNILHLAACFPSEEVLQVLQEHQLAGIDATQRDADGSTPAETYEYWSDNAGGWSEQIRDRFYTLLDSVMFGERILELDNSKELEQDLFGLSRPPRTIVNAAFHVGNAQAMNRRSQAGLEGAHEIFERVDVDETIPDDDLFEDAWEHL